MSDSPPLPYCCPGESRPITRSLHLGRLANFYPACRLCHHRHDIGTLSPRRARELLAVDRRVPSASPFDDEGAGGTYLNDFGPAEARRLAVALGLFLTRHPGATTPPEVVIGGDGRPLTAGLVSAACEGLRQAGCSVIDVGFVSAGCLTLAIEHLGAGGGLLVGNPTDVPQRVGVKLWGPAAVPLSAGGGLDEVRRLFEEGVDRPSRRSGSLRRFGAEAIYLASLEQSFHALRPLRIVLDAASMPLARCVRRLASAVALEVTLAGRGASEHVAAGVAERQLGRQVLDRGAHLGLWIDGDGERCRLVDERGRDVSPERLTLAFFRHLLREDAAAGLVVEEPVPPSFPTVLAGTGRLHRAPPTREGVSCRMRESGALAGGGRSGRFWFAASRGTADALRTLAMLLTMLSASDRHVSEVLDDAGAG